MNAKEYRELREIQTAEELPEAATYYSKEHATWSGKNFSWMNLYNENFESIEAVKVKYTNSIKELKRICREEEKEKNIIYKASVYDFQSIGNGFCYVVENKNTERALEKMCESTKPQNWK